MKRTERTGYHTTTVNLSDELVIKLDERMRNLQIERPEMRVTMGDVIRTAIYRGLDRWSDE